MSSLGQPGSSQRFAGHSVFLGGLFVSGRGLARRSPPTGRLRYAAARRAVITPGACPQVGSRHHDPATSPATRAKKAERENMPGGEAPGVNEDQDDSAGRGEQARADRYRRKDGTCVVRGEVRSPNHRRQEWVSPGT